jgi:hypothetical protein
MAKGSVAAPAISKRAKSDPRRIEGFEEMPRAPSPPPGTSELEALTYPPGLLGHATDYAYRSAMYPDRRIALWGALVGLAKILDRRVIGPSGSSTVLYSLLIGASGSGKEDGLQFSTKLLEAAGHGYERLLQGGHLASVQAIEDMIRATPNCLAVIDELGRWMKTIQDQSGNVSQLPGTLCKLWGQKPYGRYPLIRRANREASDGDLVYVQWPTMALAGASVSQLFWNACGDDDISGGFLNRCYFLDAGLGALDEATPDFDPFDPLPRWMEKLIRVVTRNMGPMQNPLPIMEGHLGPWRLTWSAQGQDAYRDHVRETRRLPEGRKRDLSIRTTELSARLSTICAVWDGWLEVSPTYFEWGWALAEHSRAELLRGASEYRKVKRDFEVVCDHIKDLLVDGPRRWMDIRSKSRSAGGQWGMEIVEKALAEVIASGEVREIPHDEQVNRGLRSAAGAPGRWFELKD